MIFQSIRLHNLFAYYGVQEFDLRRSASRGKVVLIAGRNGYGKTSLFNSIKLLFTGVNEELRRGVQRQRTPTSKQYILGAGDDWWGVMNRRARAEGKSECGIRIVWQEQGGEVEVERRWRILDGDFSHSLNISGSFLPTPITDEDEAQRFLDQRLPQGYVPFFFFDGEQVQELAEANRTVQQQHTERLLNIAPLDTLREHLSKAISEWNRGAMDQVEQARLAELEAKLKVLEHQYLKSSGFNNYRLFHMT